VVSIGVLIVAITLAVTGRYPRGLYDLLVGIARWSLRVVAYVALLTDAYPPFRLDQGGAEPDGVPPGPTGPGDLTATASPPAVPPAAGPATNRTGPVGAVVYIGATGLGRRHTTPPPPTARPAPPQPPTPPIGAPEPALRASAGSGGAPR
jgi:hypothetical protein